MLHQEVLQCFEEGRASVSAKLLLEEAVALAEKAKAHTENTAHYNQLLEMSDNLSRFAVKLHWWGDDLDRQQYFEEKIIYEERLQEMEGIWNQVCSELDAYIEIFKRFETIVESKAIGRFLIPSPFERMVQERDPGFKTWEENRDYFLGGVLQDVISYLKYVGEFSSQWICSIKQQNIKVGCFHIYAQILLDLKNAQPGLERIESLQKKLLSMMDSNRYLPQLFLITNEERDLKAQMNNLMKKYEDFSLNTY